MLILTPTRSCRETCCEILNIYSNTLLKTRNYPNCALAPFSTLHLKLDGEGPDEMKNPCRECTLLRSEEGMSRVYVTSKRRGIPSETVDSRRHENRSGLVCEALLSSKTLRYRHHGRIRVSRQNILNFEWNRHIRNPNQSNKTTDEVRGNSSRNTTSNETKGPTRHDNFDSSYVDHVSSSRFGCDAVYF